MDENDPADLSCFEMSAIIGRCADEIGMVAIGHHKLKKQKLAIKRLNLDALDGDFKDFKTDAILTRQFRHENIINYVGNFICGTELWLLMPLMGYGSALDLMNAHFPNGLPEIAISLIMKGVLNGLSYIHQKGFVLRTIKASHILISSSGQVKLTGLRYSCSLLNNYKWENSHDFPKNSLKNLLWLSPEFLKQNLQGYNCKSDVYSIGITCYELAKGKPPFTGIPKTVMLLEKVNAVVPSLTEEFHENTRHSREMYFPEGSFRTYSESLKQFYELCLLYDPVERPSADQLINHSFIKLGRRSGICLTELLLPVIPYDAELDSPSHSNREFDAIDEVGLDKLTLFDGVSWNFD